ncbi:MhpC hydrolase or acyltransferase [Pyrenophora tritici-repentis]|nr:MhpC hydrolase or acyltransferase [Pyrenophora tritici-repentis]
MIARQLDSSYFTTSSDTKLHYLQGGEPSGPLLICLHGLGGSTETFIPLVPSLPQTYNIILIDFQGFGKTSLADPSRKISITGHVVDLNEFVTSLQKPPSASNASKIAIIGHSLGAIVALHYAAAYPECIGGLALLGPGRTAGHIPAVRQRMLDLATAVRETGIDIAAKTAVKSNFYEDTQERKVDPAAREAVKSDVSTSDPEGYAQTCEALVSLDHKDPQYENIKCPIVFIAGDKDMISPIERSKDLSMLVGGKSQVEVVKSGHQPILEDVLGVQKAIKLLFKNVQQ